MSRLFRLSCLVALIFTFAPAPALFAETSELITAPLNTLTQEDEKTDPDKVSKAAFEESLKGLVKDTADRIKVKVEKPREPKDWQEKLDEFMGGVNKAIGSVIFYDLGKDTLYPEDGLDVTGILEDDAKLSEAVVALVAEAKQVGFNLSTAEIQLTIPTHTATGDKRVAKIQATTTGMPVAVLWLIIGAVVFTLRMGFVQLRMFFHAIKVTKGDYDDPEDEGEVSHFQALTTALSATVGLGNIAGVAIAISVGGPGATVWMIAAGFLGMASKFTECSLGQMYRQTRSDGSVMGGAMYYLSNGLKEMGLGGLGKILAVMFAILCIGGSFGGGGSFQVNQSLDALAETIPFFKGVNEAGDPTIVNGWIYGAIMTTCVALVILGGFKRIAQTAEKIVPAMCGVYVMAALAVILMNADKVPAAISTIFSSAMTPAAGMGGLLGVLVQGFKRAAFSNEAGVGSAAIAHSAAKTPYAVREGIVSLLEPFIDTVVVCTMTALVIVVTGAYISTNPDGSATEFASFIENGKGAALTSQAFKTTIWWFPYVLSVAVVLFAFSTIISWSYYGERCWSWLFGDNSGVIYRVIFLVFIFGGSVITAIQVLEFGDLMILGMAIPNILGVLLLSGKVKTALTEYTNKLHAGEFKEFKD